MLITVFTPTYNRAYILPKLFESLKRQSFRDFEWIIVDDGSTDNLESLVSEWIVNESEFQIEYYRKENGGMYTACYVARGVSGTSGDTMYVCLSSVYTLCIIVDICKTTEEKSKLFVEEKVGLDGSNTWSYIEYVGLLEE